LAPRENRSKSGGAYRHIRREISLQLAFTYKVVAGKSACGLGGLAASGMVAGWARRRF